MIELVAVLIVDALAGVEVVVVILGALVAVGLKRSSKRQQLLVDICYDKLHFFCYIF